MGGAIRMATAALLSLAAAHAAAQEWSWSGFGTVGGAISDRPWTYQGYIDQHGTLQRDSVFGVQLDAKFNPEWSATVQGKLAPSTHSKNQWELSASWAFLSWRPSNEWLVRAGKLRVPLYLFSENFDVGQSYDFARMPTETYSIDPAVDMTGLYVTRSWVLSEGEVSLDGVVGRTGVYHRLYTRDGGPLFVRAQAAIRGMVLSWRQDDLTLRASWLKAATHIMGGFDFPTSFSHEEPAPGVSYELPTGLTSHIVNDVLSLGLDWRFAPGWRAITELERDVQHKTVMGANTYGGHVALLRTLGRWTPYAALSGIWSVDSQRRLKRDMDAAQIPLIGPDAQLLALMQRAYSDSMPFYDQRTLAVGTSYALNPRTKLKAEWAHTWIGQSSTMIDSPAGGAPVGHTSLNVLSLSYNFVF